MRSSKTLLFALGGIATTACAGGGPPATVWFDGSEYARLTPEGWQHVSGELALPLQGESATVDGRSYPVSEMVTCDSDICNGVPLYRHFVLHDASLLVDGTVRGEVRDGTEGQRRSALAMVSTYLPPGDISLTASFTSDADGASIESSLVATADGRLVRGQRCLWLEPCPVRTSIGTWSERGVRMGSWTGAFSDSIELDGVRTYAQVNDWKLAVDDVGSIDEAHPVRWQHGASVEGLMVATRSADDRPDRPARQAVLLALTALVDQQFPSVSADLAPPPPPPPRR
jgi:hypothetical protein